MLKVKNANFRHTVSLARCKMSNKETKCPTKFWHCQTFCLVQLYLPLTTKNTISTTDHGIEKFNHFFLIKMANLMILKACLCYFFIFSPNDRPYIIMRNAFCFILKALFVLKIFRFLCFCLPLFFSLSALALEDDQRQILKFITS